MKIFVYKDNYGFVCIVLSINNTSIFTNKIELINEPKRFICDTVDDLFLYEKRKKDWRY
jgi:hypothetical protein